MLAAGTSLGPYRIVAPLGAGGMGEVYRARDARLDRDVAVKVLPPAFAGDPERVRRFEQEARAAGALDHPNVVVIHDTGTHEGAPYVVMELLEGMTLRERLSRGPVPWSKGVDMAAQAARGLAAAHERGIVHRDLKPENLFVTRDGRVKVLDFGLAKLTRPGVPVGAVEGSGAPTASGSGGALGTGGSMAPEQVRGEPADARSDVFALGAILHELATGHRAFRGATAVDTLYAILNADPDPGPGAGLSGGLGSIVRRCLEKNPGERFQSAQDLAFALEGLGTLDTAAVAPAAPARRWRAAPVLAVTAALMLVAAGALLWPRIRPVPARSPLDPKRVVVAVFENQTGDAALDPLGRMASDWITQGLSRVEGLAVVPSTSVLFVQPASRPARTGDDAVRLLAGETRAGTIVSGAYYLQGDSLRFQARITDAMRGRVLQALDPVNGPRAAPLVAIDALQQRVTGGVAASLEAVHELGTRQQPPLYEAYREFIAGFERFGTDDAAALRHFQAAVRLDPGFGAPLFYEAYILHEAGEHERVEAIMRTLEERRDEITPYGRAWLAIMTAYWAHRYPEALQHARSVERMAPRDPLVTLWVGMLARYANRPRETVDAYRRFGPRPYPEHALGGFWMLHLCASLHTLGEHRRELSEARAARRARPAQGPLWACEARALGALGRLRDAERLVDDCLAAPPAPGTPGEVMAALAQELRAHGRGKDSSPFAARAAAWYRARLEAEPGNVEWMAGLLDALRWAGRWDEAVPVTEELIRRRPHDPAWPGILGSLAARRGDRAAAERCTERLRQMDSPGLLGEGLFRRAGIAAQLGDEPRALELLRDAYAAGLQRTLGRHVELDLEPLWGLEPYRQLMRPRG